MLFLPLPAYYAKSICSILCVSLLMGWETMLVHYTTNHFNSLLISFFAGMNVARIAQLCPDKHDPHEDGDDTEHHMHVRVLLQRQRHRLE